MADISEAVHQCEVCGQVAQWRFVAPGVTPGEAYQRYACHQHFGHVEEAVDADLRSRPVAMEPQIYFWDHGFPLDDEPILEGACKAGDRCGHCCAPGCCGVQNL